MKSFLTIGLLSVMLFLAAAEKYESAGFSAEISGSGVIKNLKYAGMPLAKVITISGSYRIPEGMEKHDNRFFQSSDYTSPAKYERQGDKLTVTVKSSLSSAKLKDAVRYHFVCVFEPQKITIRNEVIQNIALSTNYYIFSSVVVMSETLFGRGVKILTRTGQEEFKVLPETYQPKFRMNGKNLAISTEKGTLSIQPDKDDFFEFMDSRSWGGQDFVIYLIPPAKWTPKPVQHPAETVWKWNYILSFTPETP